MALAFNKLVVFVVHTTKAISNIFIDVECSRSVINVDSSTFTLIYKNKNKMKKKQQQQIAKK